MLPKPSQWLPGWQPCIQVGGDVALPLRMPFWREWAGGQGLLPHSGSVASATGHFFTLHTKVLMAMLHFSRKELRKAFLDFSKLSQSRLKSTNAKVRRSFLLYAIYAVECGLKCILLITRDLKSTSELGKEDLTHDLNILLSKSEIIDGSSNLFQRMKRHGKDIPSKQLHELYRYGGQLDTRSESNLIKNLSGLYIKIKDELNQSAEGQLQ